MTTETKTETTPTKKITAFPFPLKLTQAHRDAVDAMKAELNGRPTYTDILQAALTAGFAYMQNLTVEERARLVRGF